MSNPLVQIVAHGVQLGDGDRRLIRRAADRLLRCSDRVIGVRVTIRAPHRRLHREVVQFAVTIQATLPQGTIAVRRANAAVLTTAIQDAFDRAVRRLQDYVSRQWSPARKALGESPASRVKRR